MASRFWVPGGTGNWNSTTNWSASSGGASGASFPVGADDVFFDALSGTAPSITVNVASSCLSIDFTGAINPTLVMNATLNIAGNIQQISTLTITGLAVFNLNSSSTGRTITTAGVTIPALTFSNLSGGWILQDNLKVNATLNLTSGNLNTNGKNVNCTAFNSSNTNIRSLTLGASVITTTDWTIATSTNMTFSAGTSNIIMPVNFGNFSGGGLTYNNFSPTGNTVTIINSNTFNTITLTAGKTLKITSGTTQTYTTLVANGTPSSKITIQSVTAGSAAILSKASGIQIIRNISLKDISAIGGATFYALGTTNVSGNTGWTYQMLIKQEKLNGSLMALYHIDATGTMTKVSG